MPTTLPTRSPRLRRPDLLILFLAVLAMSFVIIEVVDPAPMDVEASLIASP